MQRLATEGSEGDLWQVVETAQGAMRLQVQADATLQPRVHD
jgi:hypothetical protein